MIDIKSQIINPALELENIKAVASAEGWELADIRSLGFFVKRNFKYRRTVTVTEQSGSNLTDYQVPVELDSGNFDFTHTQTNGEDVRFVDTNGNFLNYWIEDWDAVSESAKVWVKVASIPANSSVEIYMYYGNSSVSDASDSDATFEFFDDFSNADKWTSGDPSNLYISGGVLHFQESTVANRYIYVTDFPEINDFAFQFKLRITGESTDYTITTIGIQDAVGVVYDGGVDNFAGYMGYANGNAQYSYRKTAGSGSSSSNAYSYVLGTWYGIKVFKYGENTSIEVWNSDFSSKLGGPESVAGSPTSGLDEFVLSQRSSGGLHGDMDDIRVRKYTSPEPTVTIGEEES